MSNETSEIKPFDILPSGEFRRRMLADLPDGTEFQVAEVATLTLDSEGWLAADPAYFRPPDFDGLAARFPVMRQSLTVELELLIPPGSRVRVAAVRVLHDAARPTSTRQLDASVAVDTRMMMVATSRIRQQWRVGGPLCKANLLADWSLKDPVREAALVTRASAALEKAGIALRHERTWTFLAPPVADETIRLAKEIVASVAPQVEINLGQHQTHAEIKALVEEKPYGVLASEGVACAVIFRTGFGNGIYWWSELLAGEQLVGYRCSFVDDMDT